MSSSASVRLGTLVLAALLGLGGGSQASILIREADGGTNLVLRTLDLRATDHLITRANFSMVDSAAYARTKEDIHHELEDLGFVYRWQEVMDYQTISTWYSAAQNRSVVCLESVTAAGLTHQAYRMPGRLSRTTYFPW